MMNKAINTLVLAIGDSLKNLKKRLTNYLTIGGVVLGASIGSFNTAYSASITLSANSTQGTSGINGTATLAAADNVNLSTFTLSVSEALNLASNGLDVITGTTGTLTMTLGAGADTASIESFAMSGAGNLNITNLAGGAGAFGVTSDGVLTTVGGTITVTGDTNTAVLTTLDVDGTTVGGTGAEVVLDETASNGTALLSLTAGSGNTTLTGNINGAAAGEGAVDLSASGTNAITGAIGNDFSIRLLDIDSVATFSSTVAATAIDADNTATFAGDVTAGTVTANVSGKVVTLNGNITATTITIDTASVDANKDITSNVVLANAAGDLLISGAVDQTLTGAITATDGEGSLIITNAAATGSFTATGTIGVTAARLLEVSMTDGSNAIFQSAISAETLDIDTNSAAEYIQVTAGNLIGDSSGTAAGAIEIASGAVIRLDNAVVDGTTVFDLSKGLATAAGFASAGAFTIIPSSSFSTGTVEFLEGGTLANILDTGASAVDGVELVNFVVQDSAIIDYTVANGTTTGADVLILAADKSSGTIATELGSTANEGLALLNANKAIAESGSASEKTTFNNAINGINGQTATVDTDLARQLAPQTDTISGSSVATRAMTGTVQGIVSNRMASLRSGDAFVTGMSAGNGMSANSGFIQAFGSEGEQKNTGPTNAKVYGYESETSGLAIGFDGMTENGSTIGLSASYSTTDVDGKGTGKSKNSIDSYTVSVYADKATDIGYIEGSLTYGINDNTASRIVNTAGLSRTYQC